MAKIRRYPAIAVCASAVTLGVALGNLLVPSLDQALGIREVYVPPGVVASPDDTTGTLDPTGEPGDQDGATGVTGTGDPSDGPGATEQPDGSPSGSDDLGSDESGTGTGTTEPGATGTTPASPSSPPTAGGNPGQIPPGDDDPPPTTPPADPPTTSPSPTPSPTPTDEKCLRVDLSIIELALCGLLGGASHSMPTEPDGSPDNGGLIGGLLGSGG